MKEIKVKPLDEDNKNGKMLDTYFYFSQFYVYLQHFS